MDEKNRQAQDKITTINKLYISDYAKHTLFTKGVRFGKMQSCVKEITITGRDLHD